MTNHDLISAFARARREANVKAAHAAGERSNQVVVGLRTITMPSALFEPSTGLG
jgi:hypothetical protein